MRSLDVGLQQVVRDQRREPRSNRRRSARSAAVKASSTGPKTASAILTA